MTSRPASPTPVSLPMFFEPHVPDYEGEHWMVNRMMVLPKLPMSYSLERLSKYIRFLDKGWQMELGC